MTIWEYYRPPPGMEEAKKQDVRKEPPVNIASPTPPPNTPAREMLAFFLTMCFMALVGIVATAATEKKPGPCKACAEKDREIGDLRKLVREGVEELAVADRIIAGMKESDNHDSEIPSRWVTGQVVLIEPGTGRKATIVGNEVSIETTKEATDHAVQRSR